MEKKRNAAKQDAQLLVLTDQTQTHKEFWLSLLDQRDESSNDRQPQVANHLVEGVFNTSNDCFQDWPEDIFTQ